MATNKDSNPWSPLQAPKELAQKLSLDPQTLLLASSDFGFIENKTPLAVFEPSSESDIIDLIKYSNSLPNPFTIAPRGQGHSTHGQGLTNDGVVLNMNGLGDFRNGSEIVVYDEYVDVGAEQLWIDVLRATLKHGLTPLSWTDYMYLSVGGTLSNAGINGTSFRFGPQISNVLQLDVVTGKGDLVTCSPVNNSELFYAVLGGLGQFGIITKARIALGPAPTRVKWLRLFYTDFSEFTKDQEYLISFHEKTETRGADHVAGYILANLPPPRDVSFYPEQDLPRINSLVSKHGLVYSIELGKFYDTNSQSHIEEELAKLIKGLKFIPTFAFEKDISYEEFQNRLRVDIEFLRSNGLLNVPHPWLDLFVPRSRISDFNEGVLKDIVLKQNIPSASIIFYPMNHNKWDDRMSAVTPDEDIFYALGFFRASFANGEVEASEAQNEEILEFCKDAGIQAKVYLASYKTQEKWVEHYGSKWELIKDRKDEFDPKKILSPGQKIFN
ncbi:PREDICTED: cytokinin dehydrogenase 3-like [Lupinus angustifolius]|uniref:cytokinin dehydrogenase 3-like n=1 Tax=Lupinus angustifolius TaxID=3871 RepID=UPI00092EE42B|nr:PREDICTED: cytokinin dehydrogenase 3-like [Lupinus angustifolius]